MAVLETKSTEESRRQPWRDKLEQIVFGVDTRAGRAFDIVLLVLILMSVMIVMLDSVPTIRSQHATTLRQAGAEVIAFRYGDPGLEYALVAFSPSATPAQAAAWRERIATIPRQALGEPIERMAAADLIQPHFVPVTDDRKLADTIFVPGHSEPGDYVCLLYTSPSPRD